MKTEVFEIVVLALKLVLLLMTVFVVPVVRKWILENTTKEQRDNALFWIKYVTPIAEEIYKQKGAGKLKKEWVIEWLNQNGVKLSEEQISILIDMVVKEYNQKGWGVIDGRNENM